MNLGQRTPCEDMSMVLQLWLVSGYRIGDQCHPMGHSGLVRTLLYRCYCISMNRVRRLSDIVPDRLFETSSPASPRQSDSVSCVVKSSFDAPDLSALRHHRHSEYWSVCRLALRCIWQGYPLSGISGNLEMSGNSVEVGEMSGKLERPKVGKGRGICVAREISLWQLSKMLVIKLWCSRNVVATDF